MRNLKASYFIFHVLDGAYIALDSCVTPIFLQVGVVNNAFAEQEARVNILLNEINFNRKAWHTVNLFK